MKKKVLAVVLTAVLTLSLGLVMAGPVGAHTEGDPYVTDLLAGQHTDVGDVEVWNDGVNLHVTYLITDLDWVITGTHLYVGQNSPNELTTAPGQFPYDDGDADSVTPTEVHYEIPLGDIVAYKMELNKKDKPTGKMIVDGTVATGVGPCEPVYIAAHAVVDMIEEGYSVSDCLVSGIGTDNVLLLVEDTITPALGYPVGHPGPYSGTTVPSVLAWTHSAWGPYGVAGAEWISSSLYTEDTDNNTWRLFTRSFTFPTNATNITGTLTMNCDNAEDVYLNSQFVGDGSPAIVYGASIKDVTPPSGPAHGWSSVESWDVSSILNAGNNDLWTMTRNYAWSGGPEQNPGGLIYSLCYEYDIPDTVIATETAWGNGTDFEHPNWAMYFEYTIQGCYSVDTVTVTPFGTAKDMPIPTYSNIPLEIGSQYRLVASGTYRFANWGEYGIADASWNYRDAAHAPGGVAGWYQQASTRLQVWIDGAAVTWQPSSFNPEHIYTLDVTGGGSPLKFTIMDDAYGDNSGSLTVEIYRCCE